MRKQDKTDWIYYCLCTATAVVGVLIVIAFCIDTHNMV